MDGVGGYGHSGDYYFENQEGQQLGRTSDATVASQSLHIPISPDPALNNPSQSQHTGLSARFDKRRLHSTLAGAQMHLSATQIQTESGNRYELLTFIDESLFESLGISPENITETGSVKIGSGKHSTTVRLARDITPGSATFGRIVAVKKMSSDISGPSVTALAQEEFDNYQKIESGSFFIKAYDIAHTTGKNGESKSYIFTDYIAGPNIGNAVDEWVQTGTTLKNRHIWGAEQVSIFIKNNILHTSYFSVNAVNEMHENDLTHGDINIGNILRCRQRNRIFLCDYNDVQKYTNDEDGDARIAKDVKDLGEVLEALCFKAEVNGISLPGLSKAAKDLMEQKVTPKQVLQNWNSILEGRVDWAT